MKQKYFSRYREPLATYPNFVEPQLVSFQEFLDKGIMELFKEFSPLEDYSGKKFELEFTKIELGKPKFDEHFAKDHKFSYDAPLRATVKLTNKSLGTSKEQEIFLADFPLMTDHGTFIVGGIERVLVPQLIRSSGIMFTLGESRGKRAFGAKVIPGRGAWVELESDYQNALTVRIDRKRKFYISSLLRVFGAGDDKSMLNLFADNELAQEYVKNSIAKDPAKTIEESYIEVYKKIREGDIVSYSNAKEYVESLFDAERYDISEVGRYRFNKRFNKPMDKKALNEKGLTLDDVVTVVKHIAVLNSDPEAVEDDIDHLGNRRVRFVGEMLAQKMRVGLSQMKRNIQDRMSTIDIDTTLPIKLVSPRPLQARLKEFYATNQLSQFMAQENILNEIEHLRTVSALGPGGLTRERASYEVRDVHPSHYGRVCPIHTPEGPNIGLILRLATYARINDFGVIETPYAKVVKGKITGEVEYLDGYEEEKYNIAHAATPYDKNGKLTNERVEVRHAGVPSLATPSEVDYIDVATNQAFSIATSMIPFLNHNDASRALMGSNMQKQAVPCIVPEVPLVATGIEGVAARDSGRVVLARTAGEVTAVDARHIEVTTKDGKKEDYRLVSFSQTNGNTVFHQRPSVDLGDKVKRGDVLADTSTSSDGQIALGQNMRVAFMTWHGSNYEDAIIISERLVKNSKFTTIHIEEFTATVRDTKLGPEVTTHDIPNVGEGKLKNLDEDGIIRIGAEVRAGDILVGKITPKGETQLTPEERLLRSIFGEKARDVKDSSLRMETGKRGRVIGVQVFSRDNGDSLESGIIKKVHIKVAQLRAVSVGDKLAGRHGNKGVISTILPEEDMPYDENGEPIDVILTPLGVPSRMNLGQIMELHLGLAAHTLDYQAIVPPFAGATDEEIRQELTEAGYPEDGKVTLYDGRTGQKYDQPVAIGYMYILKLHHMVEDKIHQRSIGPYSLITQQPLGGKSMNGGQRFGEMEVWALLGYGAAYTLREVLTIKSDDILGRSSAFDSIVKGRRIEHSNTPASFNVLLNNLRALSLDVELLQAGNEVAVKKPKAGKDKDSGSATTS
jgi:DNA-directed RNA polymerase subunit beta